ncbi:hypothetical protein RB653_009689 [Dictyostelium firmibasis]|uniref:Sucraseferredoxin-like family protein n=1 Tax=Dictyostelium firmibasis TaxID=79012 RepID=A0AAN7YKA9_9MYCE
MSRENLKILTLAATIGFSVAVTTLLFRYYSNKNNSLSSFDVDENNTATPKPTPTPTSNPTPSTSSTNNDVNQGQKKQQQSQPQPQVLDIEELIAKCGFCRPEMTDSNKESPNNSISTYHRHYFLCTGIPSEEWPAKLYSATPLLESFQQVMKKYENNPRKNQVVNGSDIPPANKDTLDVIIFPEMVKLVGLTPDTMEKALQYFQDNDTIDLSNFPSEIQVEQLNGKYIFICTHKQKDQRCGYCGPILVDQLRDQINQRGLEKEIQVFGTSHVGGHKYAGNVLVFPPGNWYGYVTPDDVSSIIDSTISGEVIQKLHRGTMGTEIPKKEKSNKH